MDLLCLIMFIKLCLFHWAIMRLWEDISKSPPPSSKTPPLFLFLSKILYYGDDSNKKLKLIIRMEQLQCKYFELVYFKIMYHEKLRSLLEYCLIKKMKTVIYWTPNGYPLLHFDVTSSHLNGSLVLQFGQSRAYFLFRNVWNSRSVLVA